MLYTVILAVCLASVPKSDCDETTASRLTPLGEIVAGPAQCGGLGQQILAQTALIPPGSYGTVICRRRFPTPPADRSPLP